MRLNFRLLVLFVFTVSMASCSGQSFQKQADGIVIELSKKSETDAGLLKIQVCADNIIRVVAAPGDSFSTRASLMVDKTNWKPVPWTVEENGNTLAVSTSKLIAKINKKSGMVSFYKPDGTLILSETAERGKTITPGFVMDENVVHVQQRFDSPEDEAFYGLGQHQDGIMNYKGHDVDLWQYNTVAVVPFLVSSRNYGILWDNNSRSKFGDIRDFQPISSLKLYGKDGAEGGLTAEYFTGRNFTDLHTSRQESEIESAYEGEFAAQAPEGYRSRNGGVVWSGEIESDQSGVHKFRLYSSGYMKMWLDGELVVDLWRQGWLPWTQLPRLDMEAGKRYKLRIEWSGGSHIALRYLTPETEENKDTMSLYSEVADQIDYYFIHGENHDQIIKGYREITGDAPMMPKWAMGLWQCRQRYETQKELLDVVKEFRSRRIPFDNIVLDWFYWEEDKWGDHDFDAERFPDPEGMINELHNELNTNFMISVWPKFYTGTKNLEEFDKNGWLYRRNIDLKRKDWVGYVSSFYDPYSKGARDLFWRQIDEKLFSKGVDAWWLDATEPEPTSNMPEEERRLIMNPTALGPVSRYLNTFSLMNAKGIYEGQRETDPNKRVFILTRSAFAGQQRFAAATWSGDLAARWDDLRRQVPSGLNTAMSGIPWWTTDVGGFSVESKFSSRRGVTPEDQEEWREFMTRWFQFGTFCPLLRVHGEFPYREMFEVAPDNHPAYQTMKSYDELRYRLMPYIYSIAGKITHDGYTLMRPLVMDFAADRNVLDIGDQFMFGPALLVNPVSEYKSRSREVYLPGGSGWYDLKSGSFFEGGQTVQADAPYSDIPLFVKEGSLIPFGPAIQYIDEKPADPIRIIVYTGRNGYFELYEDENINYNYENGAFSTIPITYNEQAKFLIFGDRKGEFPGMLKERTFEIVWVGKTNSSGLDLDSSPDQIIRYDGHEIIVQQ